MVSNLTKMFTDDIGTSVSGWSYTTQTGLCASSNIEDEESKPKEKTYFYGVNKRTQTDARKHLVYDSYRDFFEIRNVIFSDPYTIVFWKDGTKTIVKCSEDDIFNPEIGIAMCIAKKVYGEDKYHGIFRRAMKNSIVQEKKEPKRYLCKRFNLRCKFTTRYGKCSKYSKNVPITELKNNCEAKKLNKVKE